MTENLFNEILLKKLPYLEKEMTFKTQWSLGLQIELTMKDTHPPPMTHYSQIKKERIYKFHETRNKSLLRELPLD